jgi:hypothetical protein
VSVMGAKQYFLHFATRHSGRPVLARDWPFSFFQMPNQMEIYFLIYEKL